MRIAMIGSDYVGLVSGICFAEIGHEVVCVDRDVTGIGALRQGIVLIYEPGLDDMIARNVARGRLSFSMSLADVIPGANAIFIAVGTPPRRSDGHAVLSQVLAAAHEIAGALRGFTVVITKSTVPVGFGDAIEAVGADVVEVTHGMGLDRRIGERFLQARPGYGGLCFPKDTFALVDTARDHRELLRVTESVVAASETRKQTMARKVVLACGGSVRKTAIAVLWLILVNTDDTRDSPAMAIIEALQRVGARIRAHDLAGMDRARLVLQEVECAPAPYACAAGADLVVIAAEWEKYRCLDILRPAAGGTHAHRRGPAQRSSRRRLGMPRLRPSPRRRPCARASCGAFSRLDGRRVSFHV